MVPRSTAPEGDRVAGDGDAVEVRRVAANGIELEVAIAGEGPAILLLHGWPHTWRLWSQVMPTLAQRHRVIAPDLRGLGGSTRAADGYDPRTLAADAAALLDALGERDAVVVAIDAAVAPAFLLAMDAPARVRRLVLMEGLLGRLPGAEAFVAGGPPWWFGFHAVPGLGETVLRGHEREYVEWFLANGTVDGRGVEPSIRDAFVAAYTGEEALRCGFAHYRAMPEGAAQIAEAVAAGRLDVPTLAVAGGVVGEALHGQLRPIADRLDALAIPGCGHLVPLEQPAALAAAVLAFADGSSAAGEESAASGPSPRSA